MKEAAIPRPEYPRPDFERSQYWVNLNGWWEFALDPEDLGEKRGWQLADSSAYDRRILVPFPWQSLASTGEQSQANARNYVNDLAEYSGVAWYRRSFWVPEDFPVDQHIILRFGAVNWEADVWINGEHACTHSGGYQPFEVDITDLVTRQRENCLVVRVFAPGRKTEPPIGEFPLGKQVGHWFSQASGIWQTVWLEARPRSYVEHFVFTTRISPPELFVDLELRIASEAIPVSVHVLAEDGKPMAEWCKVVAGDGVVHLRARVPVPEARLWSHKSPQLYKVIIKAGDDIVKSYIGFRTVSVAPLNQEGTPCICINDKPVYIRGVLVQGYCPEGIYSYPSDDYIRRDLLAAKELGFNLVRLHIKLEDPRVLYWADVLGLLVWEEVPNYEDEYDSAVARQRWEALLRSMIKRDINHPSTIIWGCFNETWGLRGNGKDTKPLWDDEEKQHFVEAMYLLAKGLDKTRLVVDNSACYYDHVATDLVDWHHYTDNLEEWKNLISRLDEESKPGSDRHFVPGRRQPIAPVINSEYALIGRSEWRHFVVKDTSWGFKRMTEELRRSYTMVGYVYAELQDIEWETSCGLMTYDRRPFEFGYPVKPMTDNDVYGCQHFNGDNVLLITTLPKQAAKREYEISVDVSKFDGTTYASGLLSYTWSGTDVMGRVRQIGSGTMPVYFKPTGISNLAKLPLSIPTDVPIVTLQLTLSSDEETIARTCGAIHIPVSELPCNAFTVSPTHPLRVSWSGGIRPLGDSGLQCFGRGEVAYRFSINEPIVAGSELHIACELAAAVEEWEQTGVNSHPSRVTIAVNGQYSKEFGLPDAPADYRGIVSHLCGLNGQYGYLVNLRVPVVETILPTQGVEIVMAVDDFGSGANGLTIFGVGCGRYGIDPIMKIVR